MPRVQPQTAAAKPAAAQPAAPQPAAPQPNAGDAMMQAAATATAKTTRRVQPTSLPKPETSTADVKEPPIPSKDLSLDKDLEHGDTQIALSEDAQISRDYLDALAFNEEPVRIRIEPSAEENPMMTVDCWCNGKGAEIFNTSTKQWLETNCLPVGLVVITKRKYVEILARSKSMRVRTPDHNDGKNVDNNEVRRSHSRAHVFSVIADTDRGVEWLTRILNEAF